jgi:UDP-N-acetylmuramoyl-L-alanyl-D-glutamate--2,6-diaminopimelate ligase
MMIDRREAIALAIAEAAPTDTVVLAGKGHEDYQIIGREKFPFDDRTEARQALTARGSR